MPGKIDDLREIYQEESEIGLTPTIRSINGRGGRNMLKEKDRTGGGIFAGLLVHITAH